jgi:hypothetical protein
MFSELRVCLARLIFVQKKNVRCIRTPRFSDTSSQHNKAHYIIDLLISMAEFTDLAEYTLNDEEKDLVKKLLISIENDAFPICVESAYDLSDLFGWKNAKNRKHTSKY